MSITAIESKLPNGFHDAFIDDIAVDYKKGTASLRLTITSDNDDSTKKVVLKISGLSYLAIGAPAQECFQDSVARPQIADSGSLETYDVPMRLPEKVPDGSFGHYFFLDTWNAFIVIVGRTADIAFDQQ